jgi:hypothetical protein
LIKQKNKYDKLTKDKKINSEADKEICLEQIIQKKLVKSKVKELPDFGKNDFVFNNPKTSGTGRRK